MRSGFFRSLVLGLWVAVAAAAVGMPAVEVVGLFKDRAMLRIDGKDLFLRVGETSRGGVTLVFADTRRVVLEYEGVEIELSLSNRIASSFHTPSKYSLSIPSDAMGQYWVRGFINGQSVSFLVDTGASVIAMSSVEATRLGIDFIAEGQTGMAQTAQGEAVSHFVSIPAVEVGGIEVHDVRAAIVEGSYPRAILLGMSFLRHVEMEQQEGILMLREK
ncbi:MAG: TIGR02281 family clan AA aspartic protease [Pseudomonadales bacterium]